MARPVHIQFLGAIYHVMTRGNGRQLLFHGQDDYQRMLDGLEKTVWRTGWDVFSLVIARCFSCDPPFPLRFRLF